ncbi:MAG: 2OG-Fe(II) oxygenase [Wenzhouxiangellaceae bacterium]
MSRPDNRSLDFPAGKQAGKQAVHNAMRLDIEALIGPAAGALTQHGWYVQENAVPKALVALLRADFARLLNQDRLKRAGIGRERTFQLARQIRRDWIFWLSRSRNAHRVLLDQLECLRLALNRNLFLALFEFEAHFALYPPGAFYRRHFDSFRGASNRMVSLVLYLNDSWQEADGGELLLYHPKSGLEMARVAPRAGTLVLFLSEEIEHEVAQTRVDRASVSAWFRLNGNVGEVLDPPR